MSTTGYGFDDTEARERSLREHERGEGGLRPRSGIDGIGCASERDLLTVVPPLQCGVIRIVVGVLRLLGRGGDEQPMEAGRKRAVPLWRTMPLTFHALVAKSSSVAFHG